MVRDAVANMVNQLRERGYAPRKVGHDSWESRCPGHRSSDHALSITRNEFNHVVLECRSAENCQHIRIIRAIGFTNEHVYAETPDWVISRLSRVEIHRAESQMTDVSDDHDHGLGSGELATGSGEAPALVEGNTEVDVSSAQSEPRRCLDEGEALSGPASALRLCSAQALGSHGGSPSRDICDEPAQSPSVPASALGSHRSSPSRNASNDCGTEYRAAGRVEASSTRGVSNSPRPGVVLASARAATEG